MQAAAPAHPPTSRKRDHVKDVAIIIGVVDGSRKLIKWCLVSLEHYNTHLITCEDGEMTIYNWAYCASVRDPDIHLFMQCDALEVLHKYGKEVMRPGGKGFHIKEVFMVHWK